MSDFGSNNKTVPEESAEELYEHAPCGYLSTTPDGRIIRVNKTFADLIGAEKEQLIDRRRFADLLTIGGRIFYDTHFALMLRMQARSARLRWIFSMRTARWCLRW